MRYGQGAKLGGIAGEFIQEFGHSGVRSQGDVVVIPAGTEHEAPFREDTEVIDFFAPPRDDFLLRGKPAYMSEG